VLKQIKEVLDLNGIDIKIDENGDIKNEIKKIEGVFYRNNLNIDVLWQIQKIEKRFTIFNELINSQSGKKTLQSFLDRGYVIQDNIIYWKHYISIDVVCLRYNEIKAVDSEIFKSMGYGIQEFHIYIDRCIYDIYCKGKHPNLHPRSGKFCLDPNITFKEVTLYNIENLVKPMLSCVNLDFSYCSVSEKSKIKEAII